MTFKDLPEGQTHSENDGCGIPEHNKPAVEGTETEEAWDEIAFAKAHSEICTATSPRSERSHREGRKEFSPSDKRHCGKQLYRFLVNNGLELDINHPHNHDNK